MGPASRGYAAVSTNVDVYVEVDLRADMGSVNRRATEVECPTSLAIAGLANAECPGTMVAVRIADLLAQSGHGSRFGVNRESNARLEGAAICTWAAIVSHTEEVAANKRFETNPHASPLGLLA